MSRRATLIHGLLCLITAGVPVALILSAPVMREPRPRHTLELVCHIDREMIEGNMEDVEKCHEEEMTR